MKIIDLVAKYVNAEEMPKKIRYDGSIFEYNEFQEDYMPEYGENGLLDLVCMFGSFAEDIEIIEEKPTMEKSEDRIEKALEFLETQYNTYPNGEMWRGALKNILQGKSADDVYEPFIEDNKKIEKIARCDDVKMTHYGELYKPTENEEILRIKVNELIDEINKVKESKK